MLVVLALSVIEMVAQNGIHEIGLRDTALFRFAPNELFVVVGNDELFVFSGECPRAYLAIQFTSNAYVTFDVVALFTQRLQVANVIGAVPTAWDFVIRAQLYIRLLGPAICAPVAVFFFQLPPLGFAELRPGLAFLAHIQALQLVPRPLLNYRGKAFLALQLSHPAENIPVRVFPRGVAKTVNRRTNIVLREHGPGDAVSGGPKSLQNHRVVPLVGRTGGNKTGFGVSQPLLPTTFRFVRSGPRRQEKTLTGTRFGHCTVV